jgi:hypothetical protein
MATGDHLLDWLRNEPLPALYRRLSSTAVRSLVRARLPNEPDDVSWLISHADQLAERLTRSGQITAATATTYASRLRSVGREYLNATPRGPLRSGRTLAQALARLPLPATPEEQVAEVTALLGRWPALVGELLPALARAMERLGISQPAG